MTNITQSMNYNDNTVFNVHLLLIKDGPMGNYNSSPTCTYHSHCVYEHVSSTDTEGGEHEVM